MQREKYSSGGERKWPVTEFHDFNSCHPILSRPILDTSHPRPSSPVPSCPVPHLGILSHPIFLDHVPSVKPYPFRHIAYRSVPPHHIGLSHPFPSRPFPSCPFPSRAEADVFPEGGIVHWDGNKPVRLNRLATVTFGDPSRSIDLQFVQWRAERDNAGAPTVIFQAVRHRRKQPHWRWV